MAHMLTREWLRFCCYNFHYCGYLFKLLAAVQPGFPARLATGLARDGAGGCLAGGADGKGVRGQSPPRSAGEPTCPQSPPAPPSPLSPDLLPAWPRTRPSKTAGRTDAAPRGGRMTLQHPLCLRTTVHPRGVASPQSTHPCWRHADEWPLAFAANSHEPTVWSQPSRQRLPGTGQ